MKKFHKAVNKIEKAALSRAHLDNRTRVPWTKEHGSHRWGTKHNHMQRAGWRQAKHINMQRAGRW
eukprot:scaffold168150_cov15-Tisochrysis_lutea.AAC.1